VRENTDVIFPILIQSEAYTYAFTCNLFEMRRYSRNIDMERHWTRIHNVYMETVTVINTLIRE